MPKYLFVYHGGKQFETKEEGMAHMGAWRAWSQGLGNAVVDPGMPVGKSKTVSSNGVADDGGPNPTSGITIVAADTIEAACEMAKTCPHVDIGGTIEVAETIDMEM